MQVLIYAARKVLGVPTLDPQHRRPITRQQAEHIIHSARTPRRDANVLIAAGTILMHVARGHWPLERDARTLQPTLCAALGAIEAGQRYVCADERYPPITVRQALGLLRAAPTSNHDAARNLAQRLHDRLAEGRQGFTPTAVELKPAVLAALSRRVAAYQQ